MRKTEHVQSLAPAKWWKRIWNRFWRYFNSPSDNILELLPTLDENQIIGIATEALGSLSAAHKRFQENEQPVPEQDGSFVPLNEMVVQNSARDAISPARPARTRKTVAAASGVSTKSMTLKSQRSVGLVTSAEKRVPVDGHRDATSLSPGSGWSDAVSQAHKKISQSRSHKAANTRTNMPEPARSADYPETSLNSTEKIERTSDKTDRNTGASLWSSSLPDTSLREVIVDIDARDLKKSQSSQSKIRAKSQIQPLSSSRAASFLPFIRNMSDDLDPPPAFDEEDIFNMKVAEAFEAERRAKKAAARAAAARGQTPLGHSASAADTRAAVNLHYRSPSAAVEDWGPAPAFDEGDMKMAEALEAERRAKKAAARAAQGQDKRHAAIIGISAASHLLLSSGRSLRRSPENDSRPLPLSASPLPPTHEQKLQQPVSSWKTSAGLQTGAPENAKSSALKSSRHDHAQA